MTPTDTIWIAGAGGFAAGLIVAGLLSWLWCRSIFTRESAAFARQMSQTQAEIEEKREQISVAENRHAALQEEIWDQKLDIARLEEARTRDAEKLAWVERAREEMRDAFDALAGRTLQSQSDLFLQQANERFGGLLDQVRGDWRTQKSEMQHLMDPVQKNLTALDRHIRDLEGKRESAYEGLREQLRNLSATHSELQATTITLSQALKSPTVRGRWGEMQLRRVVEMAGMVRHVSFSEQQQVGPNGARPDMVVHLPHAGALPVDAKVPLDAYMEAMSATDERTRAAKMNQHVKAVKERVRELSQKKYWEQFKDAPDFVIMFIPNEACLGAAFDTAPDLLEYAINHQVLMTTPVTLLAMLKTVAIGWQQYRITENIRQIASEGQELCQRLETFMNHMGGLGKDLNRAVEAYNKTVGSLERRLLPFARRFQEMGLVDAAPEAPEPIEARPRDAGGSV